MPPSVPGLTLSVVVAQWIPCASSTHLQDVVAGLTETSRSIVSEPEREGHAGEGERCAPTGGMSMPDRATGTPRS